MWARASSETLPEKGREPVAQLKKDNAQAVEIGVKRKAVVKAFRREVGRRPGWLPQANGVALATQGASQIGESKAGRRTAFNKNVFGFKIAVDEVLCVRRKNKRVEHLPGAGFYGFGGQRCAVQFIDPCPQVATLNEIIGHVNVTQTVVAAVAAGDDAGGDRDQSHSRFPEDRAQICRAPGEIALRPPVCPSRSRPQTQPRR